MTISRRLILLLAIPISAVCGLYLLGTIRLAGIEKQSRIMQLQVDSVGALGSILRCFSEMRLDARDHLLAESPADRQRAAKAYRENGAELDRLLARYGDAFVSSSENQRLLREYQDLVRRWRHLGPAGHGH